MSFLLLAESGGSKTDWCLIESGIVLKKFSTNGLHPELWSDSLWLQISQTLNEHLDPINTRLYFYGAGCLSDQNRFLMNEKFLRIGFKKISVFSDIHAAGKALYGDDEGWVVIMGTGSVLFNYNKGEICDVIGGAGHLNGDEGSGYYFGKLILQSYNSGKMTFEESHTIESKIGKHVLQSIDYKEKDRVAKLSLILSETNSVFDSYHRRNVELFCETYLKTNSQIRSLSISGSYAFYHEKIIREIFLMYSIEIQNIIERPIEKLIEQICADS